MKKEKLLEIVFSIFEIRKNNKEKSLVNRSDALSTNERLKGEGKGKEEEGRRKGNWKGIFGRNRKNRKRPS